MENRCSWVISIGLVLSVIYQPDQPFLSMLFLPAIGTMLVFLGAAALLINTPRRPDFGSKAVWIPLAVISGSIFLRPFYALATGHSQWGMNAEWMGAGYGVALFALYLASRQIGASVFRAFVPAVVIVSASMVVWGLFLHPGVKSGGLVSPTNYDIVTGFLVFGWAVSGRHRWWLLPIVLIGLYFTGAPEALFAGGVLGVAMLVRRDWSSRLLVIFGVLSMVFLLTLAIGIPQRLYSFAGQLLGAGTHALGSSGAERDFWLNIATNHRWLEYWKLSPILLLGHGYNINNFYYGIPHNVVLIIIEQIGIVAAVAWVWVVGWGVWKSQWKYAWLAVIALSLVDHYYWTQIATYVWVLAGVSSVQSIYTDRIFTEEKLSAGARKGLASPLTQPAP